MLSSDHSGTVPTQDGGKLVDHGHTTSAALSLWFDRLASPVGAADVDQAAVVVYIGPHQGARLAEAHASVGDGGEEWVPLGRDRPGEAAQLLGGEAVRVVLGVAAAGWGLDPGAEVAAGDLVGLGVLGDGAEQPQAVQDSRAGVVFRLLGDECGDVSRAQCVDVVITEFWEDVQSQITGIFPGGGWFESGYSTSQP